MKYNKEELIELWKQEVLSQSSHHDLQECDWHSLCMGWAIAKGLDLSETYGFANFIRYKTALG